ncbi:MAG: BamA/TamA family outer membrane protein [Thermoanaerobaculales bacterium]|nr:BamA/TamA family outer membrane protein [Thermoanaerobaculales bacterium]
MKRRRWIIIVAVGLVAILAAGLVLVHAPAVQKPVFQRVIAAIEEQTGLSVAIGDAGVRLWPGRLTVRELSLAASGVELATVERIEAHWHWFAAAGEPHRIEFLVVDGLQLTLTEIPELPKRRPDDGGESMDPWRTVEIGRLEVRGHGGTGAYADITASMDGLGVQASLVDGAAEIVVEAASLILDRSNKSMDLGAMSVRSTASAAGLAAEELTLSGGDVELVAQGNWAPAGPSALASFRFGADAAALLEWWDANLASGLQPKGRLDLHGAVSSAGDGDFEAEVEHRGGRLELAGYAIDDLNARWDTGVVSAMVAGKPWGAADVSVTPDGHATVDADLRGAPVERVLLVAAPELASRLAGPVVLTGKLTGTVSYPFDLDTLSGDVDLIAESPEGRLELTARGARDRWQVSRARIDAAGAVLSARGELESADAMRFGGTLEVPDPAAFVARLADFVPEIALPAIRGGGVSGTFDVSGPPADPRLEGELQWRSPVVAGITVERVGIRAAGGLREMEFSAVVDAEAGLVAVEGSADPSAMIVEGVWRAEIDNLQRVADLVPGEPAAGLGLAGKVTGGGSWSFAPGQWSADGTAELFNAGVGAWSVERAEVFFAVEPQLLDISKLSAEAFGGRVVGSAALGLQRGLSSPVEGTLEWSGVETGRLPLGRDALAGGSSQGVVSVEGTIEAPEGEAELQWRPDEGSKLPAVNVGAVLAGGVLQVVTEELEAGDGALWIDGVAPLGSFPTPDWLWPDAPGGKARLSVQGKALRSGAVLELLGLERQPVEAFADVDIEASVDPARPDDMEVAAELRGLELVYTGGTLSADGPVLVTIVDRRLELAPVVLSGPQTFLRAAGSADLESGELAGFIEASLAPGFARLIPYPVQLQQPIQVEATVAGSIDRPRVDFRADHSGGTIVVRDPPLRIRDLHLAAEFADGRLWINDGRAQVNQGTMEIGGGWDPVSGQGLVAEVENVVVFVEGVLSQWNGALAVEPKSDGIATVVGELNLVAGLWDENVDLGGALFGGVSLDPAGDDPLDGVSLDLDVRGRGAVRVENNLGRFDARWDVIRVTGTAARPRMTGEIIIAPGGRFSLAGQKVTVRRGSLLFTGDPNLDPIVEIVPESDFGAFGGDEGQIDTTSMAAQGLVGGLAGALGFENETLQPAEISVETEKDIADQFMIGQRISHNIALFFATSTRDVQDRTSMLQLWNLPGLKGLALQAYEKTLTEENGGNAIQRFQWGGASLYEDRPTIRKLRLEGEWPLKTRRLKKATGLRRGQPFDPFLPFVARVRMERELAGAGYQEARVSVDAVESANAWTLRFQCEPGERRVVIFEGDVPPREIREEAARLYQHPPLENYSLRNMASLIDRYFDAKGFPETTVSVKRRGDVIVAEVAKGGLTALEGPILDGVPEAVADAVVSRLGSPAELAVLAADPERAAEIIAEVLADQGYHRARVDAVEVVTTGPESADVRARVELGEMAVVGELVVTGSDPLELTAAAGFPLREGSPLDRLSVDLAASRLRAGYDAAGYSDAVIRGSTEESADGRWLVTLHIEPGIRRVYQGVEINGLRYTKRRAIESGLTLEEGEVLKNSDLDVAAVRIANFAPIERVEVRTVPEGSTGAKVELDIVEKKRWAAELGAGWSSERGAQARFGLRDDNLFGRGFSLNLRGRWDKVEWLGFVVASLPPLPGKRLSFSSTVGFSRGDAPDNPDEFMQDESFWSIEGTRWLGRGERATGHAGEQITAYYQFTRTRTYDKYPPDPDEWWIIPFDYTFDIGLLGSRYVRDRFDSPFDPTSGYGLLLDVGYADEFLASDLKYWTALGNWSMAMGVGSSTWVQGLRLGAAESLESGVDLTSEVRFFAGGQGSIRGFDRNTVGPMEFSFGDEFDPAGGGALFILNEELRIPIKGGLRAAVFADIGQVWESWSDADFELSIGAGVGIRWATPIGPLWADVAWPVVNPFVRSAGVPPDYPVPDEGITSTKPKYYIGIGRTF